MDPIAKTSLLTAAMRGLESRRSDIEGRLFHDPYADLLAGEEGQALLQKGLEESGPQPAIAIRTHFMDQKISAAVKNGVRQIVMFASGMDTRAWRLQFPTETTIFELDRAEVLNYKEKKLVNEKLKCQRISIALDLREDWQGPLLKAGFATTAKTLWLIEGLVMYLEASQVYNLIDRINLLSKSGDLMLFDILSQTLLESPNMTKQLQFLKDIGAPWKFGHNEPEEMIAKFGWRANAIQTGEHLPERWPFPVAPRSIPNLPRGFLVEAEKI